MTKIQGLCHIQPGQKGHSLNDLATPGGGSCRLERAVLQCNGDRRAGIARHTAVQRLLLKVDSR